MRADELENILKDYLVNLSQKDRPLSDYSKQEQQICEHLLEGLEKLRQGILFPSNIRLLLFDGLNTNSIIYVSTLEFLKANPDKVEDQI